MGFKEDVRAKATELEQRVSELEKLAEQIKRERGGRNTATRPVQAATVSTGSYDAVTGSSRPSATTTITPDVDYGAIAFGLSEIATKIKGQLGATSALTEYYRGTVQYFADVFAKSDPSFNEADFKRQAGV